MLRWSLVLLLCGPALAAESNPSLEAILREIRGGYQSDDAMRVMRDVYASDRFFTFPRFHATAEYLKTQMQRAGLRNVELVDTPADGVTQVGYWTMPLAWDVKKARLEILDGGVPAESRVLADSETIPASLGMWSGPTPPGGVSAEIVWVKKGDVQNVDLRGKLALTEENPANIKWLLVKAGALGAINTFTEKSRIAGWPSMDQRMGR